MVNTNRAIREKYDRVATAYDRRWRPYVAPTMNYMLTRLPIRGDEHVLDVSCGTGELIGLLSERYPNIKLTGLDTSGGMLDVARDKVGEHASVQFHQGRAEDLPFTDHCFDVVISTSSFHYYHPPEIALQEFRRVLRSGGTLYLLDWDRSHWLWTLLHPVLQQFDSAYRKCYAPSAVLSMLADSGYTDIHVEPVRLWWIWGLWFSSATSNPAP